MGCKCLKDKMEYEIDNQRIDDLSKSEIIFISIITFISQYNSL